MTAALLTAGVLVGGRNYLAGVERTTLARAPGSDSPLSVLASSWSWAGLIFVLAVGGVIISWAGRRGWAQTWLLAVLAVAAVAGPLDQARLHTAASLNKHVGLGAWFAAIAAGYAVDRFIAAAPAGRARALTYGACVVALAFPATLGASQSWQFSTSWPNATSFIAVFRPLADHSTGRDAGRRSLHRRVLPARRQQLAAMVKHPQHRPALRRQHRQPHQPGRRRRRRPRHLRPLHRQRLLLPRRPQLRRHHTPRPPNRHRLHRNPHYHTIDVVPYGTEIPPIGQGTYIIYRYEPPQ